MGIGLKVYVKLGHPTTLGGVFVLSGAPYSTEYSARLRVGAAGQVHALEYSSLALPTAPAACSFDRDAGEVTVRISPDDVASLGVGTHAWQLDIVSSVSGPQEIDPQSLSGLLIVDPEIS